MFADPKDVEPDLIRKFNLFQQIAQPRGRAEGHTRSRVRIDCDEAVDADLHQCN